MEIRKISKTCWSLYRAAKVYVLFWFSLCLIMHFLFFRDASVGIFAKDSFTGELVEGWKSVLSESSLDQVRDNACSDWYYCYLSIYVFSLHVPDSLLHSLIVSTMEDMHLSWSSWHISKCSWHRLTMRRGQVTVVSVTACISKEDSERTLFQSTSSPVKLSLAKIPTARPWRRENAW